MGYFAKEDKIGVAPFSQFTEDYENSNCRVDVLELRFQVTDTAVHLYMACHEISAGKKPDAWKSGHLVYMALNKQKYRHWDLKESKAVDREPTLQEKVFIKYFETLDPEKTYSGYLVFNSMPAMLEQIDKGLLTLEQLMMAVLSEVPEPKILPETLPVPKNGGTRYGGGGGQKEADKLKERFEFLKAHLGESYKEYTTVNEIVTHLLGVAGTEQAQIDQMTINYLVQMMG
jgi:hypothetical protein